MRAEAVSTLIAQLARPETRVIRVDNRLRSLLTLDHAVDAVARVLAERQGRETQVVLLIEQAETLPLGTLRSLQAMAPYFVEAGRPALRVAFVGQPTFRALIAGEEFAPLRQALGFEPTLVGGGAARARWAQGKALRVTVLAALALLLAGTAALVSWSLEAARRPNAPVVAATASAPPSARPPPAAPLPASVAALEQPPPMPPPPAETSQSAALHREFDAFLANSGHSAASLTPAQRDAMVSEFMRRRAAPPVAAPAPPPAMLAPRVVIHVPDGAGAAAMSAQLLAALDGQVGRLQTRHVATSPKRPSIRYFRPGDAPAARLIAQRLASTGLAWTVRDFTAVAAPPSPGTIEVWLPRQP